MEYQNIIVELNDNIAIITINRPKALNALNRQTLSDLLYFFENEGPQINDLRGVVLTGSGEKSFVAGADITEFIDLSGEEGKKLAQRGQDIFSLIENFKCPVIAAVNGYALGGGCELAMACHIRVAGGNALFGQPEVNLGLIPGYGGTQRLIQYIGKGRAIELLMTADMIDANKALEWGLVTHVVEHGKEVNKAIEILNKIKKKAPLAIEQIIQTVNAYFNNESNGFDAEIKAFGFTASTTDFQEGATAFLEKRKANFKGN